MVGLEHIVVSEAIEALETIVLYVSELERRRGSRTELPDAGRVDRLLAREH